MAKNFDDDTNFDPYDFQYDPESEDYEEGEINDLDQLWQYAFDDYGDYVEYEFHGTGDTGGTD